MKNKILWFFLPMLLVMSVVTNSCKKESQTQLVETWLTHGQWQLASVIVYNYIGASSLPQDTLNTTCSLKQLFTFNTDHTCTYSNYACKTQNTKGNWSLTSDDLFIESDMSCMDTITRNLVLKDTTDMPFKYTKIVNAGQYSLVLQTGDISTYYGTTTKRVIVQFGFVHPSNH